MIKLFLITYLYLLASNTLAQTKDDKAELSDLSRFNDNLSTTVGKSKLGSLLYFDQNLSANRSQSCATCHNPEAGFVDNRGTGTAAAASLGDDGHSLGDRNAPSAAYASFSPAFHFNKKTKEYVGGQFWDGRAADLQAQAGGPLLNPIEMGLSNKTMVKNRLLENQYYVTTFKTLYGSNIFNHEDKLYFAITESIAAFEKSEFFSPFDSKYDRYLKGEYKMTRQEALGMSLFFSNEDNSCVDCHTLKEEGKAGETFTNYEFHNIGIPINIELRKINGAAKNHIDKGLYENPNINHVKYEGEFKVPTLRNIAITAPYMHNGVFKKLSTVVAFYDHKNNSKRQLNPETGQPWRKPEIKRTVNKRDFKAKNLTDADINALVAFMEMLTDKRYEK